MQLRRDKPRKEDDAEDAEAEHDESDASSSESDWWVELIFLDECKIGRISPHLLPGRGPQARAPALEMWKKRGESMGLCTCWNYMSARCKEESQRTTGSVQLHSWFAMIFHVG